MAYTVKDHWVLTVTITDDSLGKQTRTTKIGIPYDTGTPGVADGWSTTLGLIEAYIAELVDVTDGRVLGWSLTRSTFWTGAITVGVSADNERKGTFLLTSTNGRKSNIQVPSLDEATLVDTGQAAGLYIDGDNADITAFLTLLISGDYALPTTGEVIGAAVAGKKLHVRSGVLRDRVG